MIAGVLYGGGKILKEVSFMLQRAEHACSIRQFAMFGLEPLDQDRDASGLQLSHEFHQPMCPGGIQHSHLGQPQQHNPGVGISDVIQHPIGSSEEQRAVQAE